MRKTTPFAGTLVRTLVLTGVFAALLAVAGVAAAQDSVDVTPSIGAAEVTPVAREAIDAPPPETAKKEPAFQGLVPTTQADNIVTYGLEAPSGSDTHPILKITPDKSELVRLDRDAASIVVGNPDHLGILMDNRRLLILVPRQPGATYMTVLDESGAVIMQRHVIVASPQADYIRIRRSCAGQGSGCQETSVYYCPGMCHPVGLSASAAASGAAAPLPANPVDTGSAAAEGGAVEPAIPVTTGQ